jgi:hypothetical protein
MASTVSIAMNVVLLKAVLDKNSASVLEVRVRACVAVR